MKVRLLEARDRYAWAQMRAALWPDEDADRLGHDTLMHFSGAPIADAVFVCEDHDDTLCGFLELRLRAFAEGCAASPAPFIEGWYVAPAARLKGAGRALIAAAENWALVRNFNEIATAAPLANTRAQAAHEALGYTEVARMVAFRKPLRA